MTPPIPVSGERKRPSKSCLSCRASKSRCTGLTEQQLRLLELQPGVSIRSCDRCLRLKLDCVWAASRRPGRPRRKFERGSTSQADEEPITQAGPSSQPLERMLTASTSSLQSDRTNLFNIQTENLPQNPRTHTRTLSDASDFSASPSSPQSMSLSKLLNPMPQPSQNLASSYLAKINPWAPELSTANSVSQLWHFLQAPFTSPALITAIHSLITPQTTSPPSIDTFPPGIPTLDDLRAAILSVQSAIARNDFDLARSFLQWAVTGIVQLGWQGDTLVGHALTLSTEDQSAFKSLGWYSWGLEIQICMLTATQTRKLEWANPTSADPESLLAQSLGHLYVCITPLNLDPSMAQARATHLIAQSLTLYNRAKADFDALRLPSTATYPSRKRETAFMTAVIRLCSIISLLTISTQFTSLVGASFPQITDSTLDPNPTSSSLIHFASREIVSLLRKSNSSTPSETHSPFFAWCLLTATQGFTLSANTSDSSESKEALSNLELIQNTLRSMAETFKLAQESVERVETLKQILIKGSAGPSGV